VVEALEGLVGGLHRLEVVAQAGLRGEGKKRGDPHPQRRSQDAGEAGSGIHEGHKRGEQGRASTVGLTFIVCDCGLQTPWVLGKSLPQESQEFGWRRDAHPSNPLSAPGAEMLLIAGDEVIRLRLDRRGENRAVFFG